MNKQQPGNMDRSRRRNKPQFQPGILLSWEAFNDEAMREYLQAEVSQVEAELDELEQSLRNPN